MKNDLAVGLVVAFATFSFEMYVSQRHWRKKYENEVLKFTLATEEMNLARSMLTREDDAVVVERFNMNHAFYHQVRHKV